MRKLLIALVVLIALAMLPAAVSALESPQTVEVSATIITTTFFDVYNVSGNFVGWTPATTGLANIPFGNFATADAIDTIDPNNVWPKTAGYSIGFVYASNIYNRALDITVTGSSAYMSDDSAGDLDTRFEVYNGTADTWYLLNAASPFDVLLVDNKAFNGNYPNLQDGADGIAWSGYDYKVGQCVTTNDEAGDYAITLTFTAEDVATS